MIGTTVIQLWGVLIHYVEPYFGGGAVLLAKNSVGVSETVKTAVQ